LAAFAFALAAGAPAQTSASTPVPDLQTTKGFEATCKTMPLDAKALRSDDMRVAWAVCRDVNLVRDLFTWGFNTFEKQQAQRASWQETVDAVTRKLEETRLHMSQTRQVLQRVQLGSRKSLALAPGQWQLDLNGDGEKKPWEIWFFALPKPNAEPAQFAVPSQDASYYETGFNPNARIKVDQSDVLWALSYHQFIEGVLTAARAFELQWDAKHLVVARPEQLRAAHGLIAQGLLTSERLRQSVLAETGDDHEWLPNPRQRNTVFPIPLDAATFVTWGEVLKETRSVWSGQHLLPATRGARGVIGGMAPVCAEGQGLDVSSLLLNPPPAGTRIAPERAIATAQRACQKVSAARPISDLANRADRTVEQAGGMSALRYLYWIN